MSRKDKAILQHSQYTDQSTREQTILLLENTNQDRKFLHNKDLMQALLIYNNKSRHHINTHTCVSPA